jgi:hypothetical protein
LNTYKVIQLFKYGIDTDRFGRKTSTLPGYCFIGGPKPNKNDKAVTGRAWQQEENFGITVDCIHTVPSEVATQAFLFAIYSNQQIPDMFTHGENSWKA